MEESIPPRSLTLLQGNRDQEGADSALQPTTKWGCKEEEHVHHRDTKAMIHDLDLSMCLWEETCCTTIYI
jgi:hypothetical protein